MMNNKNLSDISREQFMDFFRNDEKLNELTPDDRIEIFNTILQGSSDISKKLLEEILIDYSITSIELIEKNE